MCWWTSALYDTCSLITLDKLLQCRKSVRRHLRPVQALEESFSGDQMREETAGRLRGQVTICPLPQRVEFAAILAAGNLPTALSEVDKHVFAAAVHHQVPVVTADRPLARAVLAQRLQVGDMALILRRLVVTNRISRKICEAILSDLAAMNDFLLGTPKPTWAMLRGYRFPD